MIKNKEKMDWREKYMLTIEEASQYFGIGQTTLRRFVREHNDENFLIYVGTKVLIKKKLFENYIDKSASIF